MAFVTGSGESSDVPSMAAAEAKMSSAYRTEHYLDNYL